MDTPARLAYGGLGTGPRMATSQRAAPGRREQRSAPPVSDAPQLLEREHELEALDGVVAAAAEGAGQMLVVQGPPGVGKTRLLADARAGGRDADVLVLDGRGVELEREFAFGVARQLLEPAVFGAAEDERARLFDGAARLAGRLFDPDPDDATGIDGARSVTRPGEGARAASCPQAASMSSPLGVRMNVCMPRRRRISWNERMRSALGR